MKSSRRIFSIQSFPRRQRGVALFVVLVIVLLTVLLGLWSSRTALFSELVLGNDADYQRAYDAASTLLQDAEYDLLGRQADGSPCSASACRKQQARAGVLQFPMVEEDVQIVKDNLYAAPSQCQDAICLKRTGVQDWWNDAAELAAMKPLGAAYGQYTGAVSGQASNPILMGGGRQQKAWYWIEMMHYGRAGSGMANIEHSRYLELNLKPSVLYRITAMASGNRKNTMVVLQQTYARTRQMD